MAIWAIADLHLALGVPSKNMAVFGHNWVGYMDKIAANWKSVINPSDLVLIPGDISWALKMEEAKIDLEWIDALPGTKILCRGNHDYWWDSPAKVKKNLPPSCHIIQNDAFHFEDVSIGGTRLWDTSEFNFDPLFPDLPTKAMDPEDERIFNRELHRLELSLQAIKKEAKLKIAMTHYPPIGLDLRESKASALLERYGISICVFGHLHNITPTKAVFGEQRGIHYYLTAADYLDFKPLRIK